MSVTVNRATPLVQTVNKTLTSVRKYWAKQSFSASVPDKAQGLYAEALNYTTTTKYRVELAVIADLFASDAKRFEAQGEAVKAQYATRISRQITKRFNL